MAVPSAHQDEMMLDGEKRGHGDGPHRITTRRALPGRSGRYFVGAFYILEVGGWRASCNPLIHHTIQIWHDARSLAPSACA